MNILERYLKGAGDTLYVIVNGEVIGDVLLVLLPSDNPGLVLVKRNGKLRFIKGDIEIKVVKDGEEEVGNT